MLKNIHYHIYLYTYSYMKCIHCNNVQYNLSNHLSYPMLLLNLYMMSYNLKSKHFYNCHYMMLVSNKHCLYNCFYNLQYMYLYNCHLRLKIRHHNHPRRHPYYKKITEDWLKRLNLL